MVEKTPSVVYKQSGLEGCYSRVWERVIKGVNWCFLCALFFFVLLKVRAKLRSCTPSRQQALLTHSLEPVPLANWTTADATGLYAELLPRDSNGPDVRIMSISERVSHEHSSTPGNIVFLSVNLKMPPPSLPPIWPVWKRPTSNTSSRCKSGGLWWIYTTTKPVARYI